MLVAVDKARRDKASPCVVQLNILPPPSRGTFLWRRGRLDCVDAAVAIDKHTCRDDIPRDVRAVLAGGTAHQVRPRRWDGHPSAPNDQPGPASVLCGARGRHGRAVMDALPSHAECGGSAAGVSFRGRILLALAPSRRRGCASRPSRGAFDRMAALGRGQVGGHGQHRCPF